MPSREVIRRSFQRTDGTKMRLFISFIVGFMLNRGKNESRAAAC